MEKSYSSSQSQKCAIALLVAIVVQFVGGASAASGPGPGIDSPVRAAEPQRLELFGGWRLVRTPNPLGGADAISIMHTADTSRSDIDFAGLMIRCGEHDPEVAIVSVRSFSFHAQPKVMIGGPGDEQEFNGTVVPPGTVILLPHDATDRMLRSWQAISKLYIRVNDGQAEIRGVVNTEDLSSALRSLIASCRKP